MKRFVLLAPRRSGTSLLISSLNSHPQIHCYKYVFHRRRLLRYFFYFEKSGTPFFKYWSTSIKRQIDYIFRRKHLIDAFLTELYESGNDPKAVGVRIIYPQEYPEVLEWVIENDVSVIHLIRENFLKSIVYHSTSKTEPVVHLSPHLLEKRLAARLNQIETYRAMFKDKRYCEVSNEAFVANPELETRRMLDFLGVDQSMPLTLGLQKQNPELADVLENYREIAETFKGTIFEKYL